MQGLRLSLLFIATVSLTVAEIVVPPPHPFAGTWPQTPFQSFGPQSFRNITAEMVTLTTVEQSLQLCVGFARIPQLGNRTQVEGKVVAFVYPITTTVDPSQGLQFVDGVPGCAYELMVSNCQLAGCIGMVRFYESETSFLFNSQVPIGGWWSCNNCSYSNPARPAIDFPVTQAEAGPVATQFFFGLLSANASAPPLFVPPVIVTMTSDESHFQYLGRTFGIFAQVVLSIWCLVLIGLAIFLLQAQISGARAESKPFPLLPFLALSLELWVAILRLIILLVDPFIAWGRFYPIYIIQLWDSFFWSWSLIATFAIASFWFQISIARSEFNPMSAKFLVPLFLFSLFLLAAEYIPTCFSIFAPLEITDAQLGRIIAQSICYWGVSVFFVVSAVRVLMILGRGANLTGRKTLAQKKIARYVIALSVLLTAFGAFIYAFTTNASRFTNGWYGLTFVQFVFLLAISTLQITIFTTAKLSKKTSETATTQQSNPGNSSFSRSRDSEEGYVKVGCTCCGRTWGSTGSSGNTADTVEGTSMDTTTTGATRDASAADYVGVETGVITL